MITLSHIINSILPQEFPQNTFIDSTPACCQLPDGNTLTNIRFNNTVINDEWEYSMHEEREITHNVWVKQSQNGTILASGWLRDPEPINTLVNCPIEEFIGRQDVRLFVRKDGTILYTASVCRSNDDTNIVSSKNICIEQGTYDMTVGQ